MIFSQKVPPLEDFDADTISRRSQLSSDQFRLAYVAHLSKALVKSASEHLKPYEDRLKPIASKLSKVITFRRTPYLAHLFKFAAHLEQETRYVASLSLSHVSQVLENHSRRSLFLDDFVVGPQYEDRGHQKYTRRSGEEIGLHITFCDGWMIYLLAVGSF